MTKLLSRQTEHYLHRVINLTLLLAIVKLTVGCQTNSPNSSSSQSAITPTTSPDSAIKPLIIATIPSGNSAEQNDKLKALADYLQKSIQRPVSFEIAKNYDSAVDLIVKEKVDIAYLGPLAYVESHQQNSSVEPIVMAIDKDTGRPWYTSVIVVNTKKGIKSFSDLKGKRFGFVSPSSTSGFLLPMSALEKNHIDPTKDFTHIRYSVTHDQVEKDLAADRVDAIADNKSFFTHSQAIGKLPAPLYQIIWESDPIPNSPIAINKKKFSPEMIDKLQRALIDAPIGMVHIDGGESSGYTLAKDRDFEGIRQIYFHFRSVKVAAK